MISRWLPLFLEMLLAEKGASLKTLEAYKSDLTKFLEFYSGRLEDVTESDIGAYMRSLSQAHFAVTTQQRRLSALRQFFKFLVREGHLEKDPTLLMEAPKKGLPLPKTLSKLDVEKLLETARQKKDLEDLRMTALLEVLYATGLRVSELVGLPISAIRETLKSDQPLLWIMGKGQKERMVILSQTALKALGNYLEVRPAFLGKAKSSPWLFPSSSQEGHLTRQRFGQLLKDLALKSGLDPSILSPHILRHAFATHLLRGGADLLSLQKLLGHADISTTQIYTHIAQEDLAELVETCHPLAHQKR
ncbi:Tyrosine recombinase XerD [Candidatus Bealeia paramacronuclearis]|uniref:Tyrosine recombinase XerC n=1 Tax=Candidatus Bealeia paramacronuclearis TaxID=1921001 RepID=A0ABZ2C4Q4_9PROT|nr:Tyrosine recombinase XerD [Candidatus Bealeia paramacronuclearis]